MLCYRASKAIYRSDRAKEVQARDTVLIVEAVVRLGNLILSDTPVIAARD